MTKPSVLQQFGQEILQLIFPPRCAVCERLGKQVICDQCRDQFELIQPPYCQRCGQALPPQMGQGDFICGDCRQDAPRFDAARSVGLHRGPLRLAVLRFKFSRRRELLKPLAELLADRVQAEMGNPTGLPCASLTGIVPVVLHPRRKRWRGFDQAVLLSRGLSGLIDIPCLENILIRQKDTEPQVGLTAAQRRENMREAFAVTSTAEVAGGNFLLIDDVYTTGSTMNTAAQALSQAGAEAVHALTITRALPMWHPEFHNIPRRVGDEEDSADNL